MMRCSQTFMDAGPCPRAEERCVTEGTQAWCSAVGLGVAHIALSRALPLLQVGGTPCRVVGDQFRAGKIQQGLSS